MFPKHPQTAQLVKTPGIEYLTYGILALLQSPLNGATKYSPWLENPSSPIYLLFPGSKSEFCFVETPKHLCPFSLDKPTLPHWFLPSQRNAGGMQQWQQYLTSVPKSETQITSGLQESFHVMCISNISDLKYTVHYVYPVCVNDQN